MLRINSYGRSDVGLKRSNNEDAFIIKPEFALWALADGMGGAAAGEIASQIFVETALSIFAANRGTSAEEIIKLIQKTFLEANTKILKHVQEQPAHKGMGCTAELLTFCGQNFLLGHVGDSRTYLLRQGKLKQLTKDHSLVQEQIDQGLLRPEEAKRHNLRHVIIRAVGVEDDLPVDLIKGKVFPDDMFIICSDGLSDLVEDKLIQDTLSNSLIDLEQKGEKLISLAKAAGGHDNITVILCQVEAVD
ncbi:MAG: Stp1/IreP family PP2C-type Ser/Thr phosphatase [Thermodesulfobacteriota bacterium]